MLNVENILRYVPTMVILIQKIAKQIIVNMMKHIMIMSIQKHGLKNLLKNYQMKIHMKKLYKIINLKFILIKNAT